MAESPEKPRIISTVRLKPEVRSTVRLNQDEKQSKSTPESSKEFKLEIGQTIEVKDAKVFVVAGLPMSEINSGQLTVTGITEIGTPSTLKIGGKLHESSAPDRYYTFRKEGTDHVCSASETDIKAGII